MVVPDFLYGDPIDPDYKNNPQFDVNAWLKNHDPVSSLTNALLVETCMHHVGSEGLKKWDMQYVSNRKFNVSIKLTTFVSCFHF